MKSLPVALAVLGCALVLPAAADADTYSLGQSPEGVLEGTSTTCAAGCTIVQDRNANLPGRLPASFAQQGTIVKWRVRGAGQARLQRIAFDTDGKATVLGATEFQPLTGGIQEFPASLPIHAGEAVGIELTAGSKVDSVDLGPGESTLTWAPALAGTPLTGTATEGAAIAFQAVVEAADGGGTPPPGGGTPPGGDPPGAGTPQDADPYAAIRKAGPHAKIAGTATRKRGKVAVTVTNPYAFTIKGKLQLKRGRKVVAKAGLNLGANATKTVKVRVRGKSRKLKAVATLRGPVGSARTTTRQIKLAASKPTKPGKAGTDGNYRGSGAGADWVMVIKDGVVTNFNGSISIYCTKAGKQQSHTFAMIGDDPDPAVAADGSFAWEATSGYGFDKLKFDGVVKGGQVTGKMMVESRPLIQGTSPITGLPRLEAEYCFAGRDYTLKKG